MHVQMHLLNLMIEKALLLSCGNYTCKLNTESKEIKILNLLKIIYISLK